MTKPWPLPPQGGEHDAGPAGNGRSAKGALIHRHRLSTRLWHWLRAAMLTVLLMSGLAIFNAHPRLYWGHAGADPDPAWLEIRGADEAGYLRIGSWEVGTTGVLGWSASGWGHDTARAFPTWATLPGYYDLAGARRWHLSTAWGFGIGTLLFAVWGFANGHIRRDLLPRRHELSPQHLWRECCDHAALRVPRGEAARRYNALQKLSYIGITAIVIPVIILTGLSMSPRFNAIAPWLPELFGGRQSARSVHFIASWILVLFVAIHILMVVISGPINGLRSMITGRYRLPKERDR